MADVQHSRPAVPRAAARSAPPRAPSGKDVAWLGWVIFVGIMLLCSGLITVVQGLVALFNDDFYQVAASSLAVGVNYTVWGWALVVVGAGLLAAGLGVILGYPWARFVAIVVILINMLVNLGFDAANPLWTVIVVAFEVLALYALVVHGGDTKALRAGRQP
jgi:hypothetical protein